VTELTVKHRSSLTVHLTHELSYEALLVCGPLAVDRVPARQYGIPLVVRRQLDVRGLVLIFDILFTAIARKDPYSSVALAHFS
jgi:hypothetical protein